MVVVLRGSVKASPGLWQAVSKLLGLRELQQESVGWVLGPRRGLVQKGWKKDDKRTFGSG